MADESQIRISLPELSTRPKLTTACSATENTFKNSLNLGYLTCRYVYNAKWAMTNKVTDQTDFCWLGSDFLFAYFRLIWFMLLIICYVSC